jgi:hypothetical protein
MRLVPELLGKEPIQPVIRVRQGRGDLEAGATEPMSADGHQQRFGRNPSTGKVLDTPSDQFRTGQEKGCFHTRILYDDGGNNQTDLSDLTLTCRYRRMFPHSLRIRSHDAVRISGFRILAEDL